MSVFTKATKAKARLRLAIVAPTGGGKTYTALALAQGRKTAVIDTENGSAEKYADLFNFDVLRLADCRPNSYIGAIAAAEAEGYEVIIIDSMTHAWKAAQDMVDVEVSRSKAGNSFQAWGKVTPLWNSLIHAIVSSKCHVIATMRSKTEWVIEKDDRGKNVPRKIGTKAENRDGIEYEFDVVLEMDQDHTAWAGKTRCPALDGITWKKPGRDDLGAQLFAWLEDGATAPAAPAPAPAPAAPAPAPAAAPAPKPVAWTAEQTAEWKAGSQKMNAYGDQAKAELAAIKRDCAGKPPADCIDALAAACRRWDDIADQAKQQTAGAA
ncbi:MAG: ATP-binding protein [Planctomycetes bacterium]|nr:ATP-binding protein [Planctomycetota bacterium]